MLRYIEIRCIEARLRNLLFYTTLSDEPIRINARRADIESSLPKSLFVLCHHREHRPCADAHTDGVPAVKR